MTLGLALAAWTERDERMVAVAADTRISSNHAPLTDAGLKTYELGGRCAMVTSGHALPPMMTAEITRSFVENHNRRTQSKKVSFFDTVRLASFFLKRAAEEQGAISRVVVAGFLEGGAPCLASIVVSPGFNRAAFHKVEPGATCAMPVGDEAACRLLLEAMAQAKLEGRRAIVTALNILHYTSRNEGGFQTVGGGISFGACIGTEEHFSWPVVEIDGARYLRGMDVTEFYRNDWPMPEIVQYDENWCTQQDVRVASLPLTPLVKAGTLAGFNIDDISPDTLFTSHSEPDLTAQVQDHAFDEAQ